MNKIKKQELMDSREIINLISEIHYNPDDIDDGDIVDRVENGFFRLKCIPIDSIEVNSVYIDQDNVDEIKNKMKQSNFDYPPIVIDSKSNQSTIIDGNHRLKALKELKSQDCVMAYVKDEEDEEDV